MARGRKTWQEKLHNGMPAKIETIDKPFGDVPAGAKMLVPNPEMVDEYIRNIPEGVQSSVGQMRKDLAAAHGATFCCPLTSGIFLRIVAEAAWEEHIAGKSADSITPFWRMIDSKAPAAKKLTFGTDFIKAQRAYEHLKW